MRSLIVLLLCICAVCAQVSESVVTNETVATMALAGVPDDVIILTIKNASRVHFFLTPSATDALLRAKVSEAVIKVMAAPRGPGSAPPASSPPRTNVAPQTTPQSSAQPLTAITTSAPARPLTSAQEILSNESVLKMARAGVSEDVMLSLIKQHPAPQFKIGTEDIISLKQGGVPDKVIEAILARATSGSGTPTAASPPTPTRVLTVIKDGTPLRLRLNRNLSSADAKVGETVDFEVLEDVMADGNPVIAKGSAALATVTQAQPKRRMARGGKLDVTMDYARLVNGEKVALRAVKETKGGGHTGAMTGGIIATSIVFFPAAPLFLFMHGKDIIIPKGTEITAYVNGDLKVDLQTLRRQ
ncbi:MAG: hypothetical protein JJE04_27810 [Acidobacteriia bacterium]|nr:hypothetical protein [Terriglobia bacterium]